MSIYQVGVINGPSRAALQAAVCAPDHQHVAFATDEGSFEAQIDACEDLGGNEAWCRPPGTSCVRSVPEPRALIHWHI